MYDASYGSDVIGDDGGRDRGSVYTPVRGAEVMHRGRRFLDEHVPLLNASHADVTRYAVVEGALRLPFGLAALRLEVIGHAKEAAAAQTLFPLLRRVEVGAFLAEMLPELADDVDGLAPLPARALRRYVLPPAAIALVLGAAAWPVTHFGALIAVPVGAWGLARFRAAGWRLRDGRLAVRHLMLARTTVLAPAVMRESVTLGQTVLQRRGRLADLVVAFGKRTRARIHHLDVGAANEAYDAIR